MYTIYCTELELGSHHSFVVPVTSNTLEIDLYQGKANHCIKNVVALL